MIGELVAAARKSRNLTQTQLAGISGIEQANISAIERGARMPSADTLHRLLHGCGYALAAQAGSSTIACPPPSGDELLDGLLTRAGRDEPTIVTRHTPMATRVKVLTGVLDAAEAVVRARA